MTQATCVSFYAFGMYRVLLLETIILHMEVVVSVVVVVLVEASDANKRIY